MSDIPKELAYSLLDISEEELEEYLTKIFDAYFNKYKNRNKDFFLQFTLHLVQLLLVENLTNDQKRVILKSRDISEEYRNKMPVVSGIIPNDGGIWGTSTLSEY